MSLWLAMHSNKQTPSLFPQQGESAAPPCTVMINEGFGVCLNAAGPRHAEPDAVAFAERALTSQNVSALVRIDGR